MKKYHLILLFVLTIITLNSCRGGGKYGAAGVVKTGQYIYDKVTEADKPSNTFKGSYKSCNIDHHNCPKGIDRDRDGYCDNCMDNGYCCPMAFHH